MCSYAQDVEVLYPFNYTTDYQDVFVAEGGKGFAVGTCHVLATTENGTDWSTTTMPPVSSRPTMVVCTPGTNCQTVWIGADQELWRSTDGGANWTSSEVEDLFSPRDILFLDNDVLILSASSDKLFRSVDGGETWEFTLVGSYRDNPDFVSNNLGFLAVQDDFNFFRSTDQGITWDSIYHFEERPVYLDMVDENIGYLYTQSRNMFKTTDGGVSWTMVNTASIPASPRHLFALDENNLIMSSFPTSLVFSNDGGATWSSPPARLESDAYGLRSNGIHRSGNNFWVASNTSAIIYSDDALATRTNVFPADRESIESIQFVDDQLGYALCERTGMFKTTDGGDTWARVETNFGTVSRDFMVTADNKIIIPYNSSGPQVSEDGGDTWTPLFPAEIQDTAYVFQIEQLPGGRLYLMGSVHGVYSDDDGASWNVVYHEMGGFSDMLYFYDDQLGFSGGQGGRLHRTDDGGETWTNISTGDITSQPIRNLYMRDAMNGFINISSQTYCTNDAGLTWSTQNCDGYNPPNVVLEAPDGSLYSSRRGDEFEIYRSVDQGLTWDLIQSYCNINTVLRGISRDSRYLYGGWTGSLITRLDIDAVINDVKEEWLPTEALEVFPNPTSGVINLYNPLTESAHVQIFSSSGQLVQQTVLAAQARQNIHLTTLPNGLYYVLLTGQSGQYRAKVLKQ